MTVSMDGAPSGQSTSVDEPLISAGESGLDRLPGLLAIFEGMAAGFSREIGTFTEAPILFALKELDAKRVSDLSEFCSTLNAHLFYRADSLGANLIVAVDAAFRQIIIDMLLGSGLIEPKSEDSAPTPLESQLIDFSIRRLLLCLSEAFSSLQKEIAFVRDEFSRDSGFFALGAKNAVVIVCQYRLRVMDHEGAVALPLPRAALDRYRAVLARTPGTDGLAQDERWTESLYDNVVQREIRVDVKLEARGFTLGDISQLEIGDLLRLPAGPSSPIRVDTDGRTLFWCTLGQKDGFYTIQLEDLPDRKRSFIEKVLGV